MSKKNNEVDGEKHHSFSIVVPTPIDETAPEVIKVPFAVWFDRQLKMGKVKKHQDYALSIFFDKQGLNDPEDPDKYEESFKSF